MVDIGPDRRSDEREVYFVLADTLGLVKIGIANSALSRIASLRTQSPDKLSLLGVMPCGRDLTLERRLHSQFSHLRDHGEWFRATPELMSFIKDAAVEPRRRRALSLLEKRLLSQRRREARRVTLERAAARA